MQTGKLFRPTAGPRAGDGRAQPSSESALDGCVHRTLTAARVTAADRWEQPTCPSTDGGRTERGPC